MTGARPKPAARRMATAVQPDRASSACSPGASTSRSSNRRASLRANPWSGPGVPRKLPAGARVPRSSDGREAVQVDGTCSW